MSATTEPATETVARAARLLGGPRVLRRRVEDAMAAHRLVSEGMPGGALNALVANSAALRGEGMVERALGLSSRTVHRYAADPDRTFNPEQGGRVWRYAEILARAEGVFGGREAAEAWLSRPATALDRQRPVDLLASPPGARLVEDLLDRLEFGVFT